MSSLEWANRTCDNYDAHTTSIAGNGFIEGRELDAFLREFISSVSDTRPEVSQSSLFHTHAILSACLINSAN